MLELILAGMECNVDRGPSRGERATGMKEKKYIHVRATKQNSKASSSFLLIDLRRPLLISLNQHIANDERTRTT